MPFLETHRICNLFFIFSQNSQPFFLIHNINFVWLFYPHSISFFLNPCLFNPFTQCILVIYLTLSAIQKNYNFSWDFSYEQRCQNCYSKWLKIFVCIHLIFSDFNQLISNPKIRKVDRHSNLCSKLEQIKKNYSCCSSSDRESQRAKIAIKNSERETWNYFISNFVSL